jgi:hypothetical protein
MSCDIALSGAILFAAFQPQPTRPLLLAALADAPAPAAAAQNPLAREPLYADIVGRAGRLKRIVDGYRQTAPAAPLPDFQAFQTDIAALAALDLQGHLDLAKRGTDGDLKCILKGISMDLPRKLSEVEAAAGRPDARRVALDEMFYLLRDNVEVITSPPQPAA